MIRSKVASAAFPEAKIITLLFNDCLLMTAFLLLRFNNWLFSLGRVIEGANFCERQTRVNPSTTSFEATRFRSSLSTAQSGFRVRF